MSMAAQHVSASPALEAQSQQSAELRTLVAPGLVLPALLLAWIGATAVWGFNGFIGGADAAVLLVFAIVLRLTRE